MFLDGLGIATTADAIDRDQLTALCRNDATLITHEETRRRVQERHLATAQATADAVQRAGALLEIQAAQRLADAQVIVQMLQ